MQPLGRKAIRFPSKTDCHPRKPYVNWWEADKLTDGKNKTDRQRGKKEINNGIMDYDFEDIDRIALNAEEIKVKHLFEPGDITTIKNIEKNHHKKLF